MISLATAAQMDRWAAKLDARFKRANLGDGCWNCGCPDVQYVRSLNLAGEQKRAIADFIRDELPTLLAQALPRPGETFLMDRIDYADAIAAKIAELRAAK